MSEVTRVVSDEVRKTMIRINWHYGYGTIIAASYDPATGAGVATIDRPFMRLTTRKFTVLRDEVTGAEARVRFCSVTRSKHYGADVTL